VSELYTVTIEKIEGPRVAMRVTTVHPDAGPPPDEPSFPINLLTDLWSNLDRGFVLLIEGGHGLTEEEGRALARVEPGASTWKRLLGYSVGFEQPITDTQAKILEELQKEGRTPSRWNGCRIGAWSIGPPGMSNIILELGGEEDLKRVAREMVVSTAQDEQEHQESYQAWPQDDDSKLPRARITVELKDPALLSFVRAGMKFDTAMYF
jgi:hypothetical protein